MTTCLLFDHRPRARDRLERWLRSLDDVDVVCADDLDELVALVDVVREQRLVVVGLARVPGVGDPLARVLAVDPAAAILVAGDADARGPAATALAGGAVAFLRWDAPRALLRTLVATAAAPSAPAPATLRDVTVDVGVARDRGLSGREVQVLLGMSRGLTNAEIGRKLYLSDHTVKAHARRLFPKLDATDRAQAVSHAHRWGVLR